MKAHRDVLIVENEILIRRTLATGLGRAGWVTRCARDAEQALQDLRRSDVAVMIVDVKLPGMGGFELINASHSIRARTEVVVMTGHGRIDWAIAAMKGGAVDFLVKPFSIARVLLAAERALERRTLRWSRSHMRASETRLNACDRDTSPASATVSFRRRPDPPYGLENATN